MAFNRNFVLDGSGRIHVCGTSELAQLIYCVFAVPVKVSVFLDSLIAPPTGFETFRDALRNTPINDQRLAQFLNGHVFFNHFIHMEEKLIMRGTVQSFNRCAALQLTIQERFGRPFYPCNACGRKWISSKFWPAARRLGCGPMCRSSATQGAHRYQLEEFYEPYLLD